MRVFLITSHLILFTLYSEAQLYNTGLIFDDTKYNNAWVKPFSRHIDLNKIPASYSLKNYCPRPGNQLQMNSSAAWATAWSALGILRAKQSNEINPDKIALNGLSPAFVMAYIKSPDDEDCQKDLDLFEALNFIFSEPQALHRDINDFCPSRKELNQDKKTLQLITGGFTKLIDNEMPPAQKIFTAKKSIAHNYPVVIGMYSPPSFQNAKSFWQPAEYERGEYPGQALCIIGYDDKMYGGSFEVLNSWGSRWGNDGFMWIRYEDFVKFTKYAYDVFLIDNKEGIAKMISGSAQLRSNSEKVFDVKLNKAGNYDITSPLSTGTFFRIYLNKTASAFVYVFGIDESNQYYRIFPHRDSISAAIIYPDEEIAIPGEDNYIQLTGDPGKEKLCILYSLQQLDIAQLLRRLKQMEGDIYENISVLTDGKLVKPSEITWANAELLFNTKSLEKSIVLIQIDVNHL